MIWLLAHPLPPPSVNKLHPRHTGRLRKKGCLLKERGKRMGEEPNQTTARKAGIQEITTSIGF
jgi:hypothetical protein